MTNPDYNGCDMTREIARFYASLAKYNSTIARYDINGEFPFQCVSQSALGGWVELVWS